MTDDDIAARHADILGSPPRVLPLADHELTGDAEALVAAIRTITHSINEHARPGEDYEIPPIPTIVPTMARHPHLFRLHTAIGVHLSTNGLLPPREREIATLRILWLCRAPYAWGEHVRASRMMRLLDRDDTERITIGSAAPDWTDHERTVTRAAEELYADAMVSDATWAALSERYDQPQRMELLLLIGQYQSVAYYQNALRLALHEGNEGLAAR